MSDFEIKDGVLKKYNGSGGGVIIPEGVKSIGYRAFDGCSGLTGVKIPAGVTSIETSAFVGCSNFTSVEILMRYFHIISGSRNVIRNLTRWQNLRWSNW